MDTKDGNHRLDIWHMECSDHAAAREKLYVTRRRERPKTRRLDDVSSDLRKMGINEW
jgi:hypothetical protein